MSTALASKRHLPHTALESRPRNLVLDVRGLRLSFGGNCVVGGASGLDFALNRGDVVLLRGANGSGKTTLLNILSGNLTPDAGSLTVHTDRGAAAFQFPLAWWQRGASAQRFCAESLSALGVARTWQDSRLFGSQTLLDNVAVAAPNQPGEQLLQALLRPRHVRGHESKNLEQSQARLASAGLTDRSGHSADRISLGQGKRIAILRSLHAQAEILLLDEPLAGLDAAGIDQVLNLVRQVAATKCMAIVIVEHSLNLPAVLPLATRIWTLRDGALMEEVPADVVPSSVIRQEGRWLARLAPAGSMTLLLPKALPGGARLTRLRASGAEGAALMLDVQDARLLRGRRELFTAAGRLSFQVSTGDIALLEAPNGWGKTSLLRALAGLEPLSGGKVTLQGSDITCQPTWARARQGVVFGQAGGSGFGELHVQEALALAGIRQMPAGLAYQARRVVSSLSGGEQKRVALESAFGQHNGRLLLLDEPFSALDEAEVDRVVARIHAYAAHGAVLIAVPAAHAPTGG